jgi:hypothetical protein
MWRKQAHHFGEQLFDFRCCQAFGDEEGTLGWDILVCNLR